MSERKRLVLTVIVSLVGIVTGLFLGGDLLPSQGADRLYDVKPTTTKTVTTVSHSHDGIPTHTHTTTTVVTTTVTTPHGYAHDFAPVETSSVPVATVPETNPTQQTSVTVATVPEINPAQQPPKIPEITSTSTPGSIPTIQPKASTSGAGNYTIKMYDMLYVPKTIVVPVGSTVTWSAVWMSEAHDLVLPGYFETFVAIDKSFSWTFTEPGTYQYLCVRHGEAGTVTVK